MPSATLFFPNFNNFLHLFTPFWTFLNRNLQMQQAPNSKSNPKQTHLQGKPQVLFYPTVKD
jgi:hypothetical protein